jgi:hypothetical protein
MKVARKLLIVFALLTPASGVSSHELGVGSGATYIFEEKRVVPNFHIHYKKGLRGNFGGGAGIEYIADDHGHAVFLVILNYSLNEHLNFSYMPGVSLKEGGFVHHVELTFSSKGRGLHIDPFLGTSLGKDRHISVGIHVGF